MDVKKVIREYLLNELKDSGFHQGIRDDESLNESDIMDSLAVLIITDFLQDRFGIIVDANKLNPDDFDSVNALTSFVEKNLGKEIQ